MATTSTSNFDARGLMAKGKRAAAAQIHADCIANAASSSSDQLNQLLDNLLNPAKSINEWETIDWCKWLIAGGRTPDEFAGIVRTFDNATTCGLVWTPNFVAYRCRTCGISPCMSLCTECFKKGNHHRHDFNMFLSQAGGACDCGDTSVMKESGFCDRHGANKSVPKDKAPTHLMCVAQAMMPRVILRLVQHLREQSTTSPEDLARRNAIADADAYITMLLDFNNMGGLMRRVMTEALTHPQQYRALNEIADTPECDYEQYVADSHRVYEEALASLTNPAPNDAYKECAPLQEQLSHNTFLEELVFWTVKFEFPQKVVCLLLNMLPDTDYKEALTCAFVLHYSRISKMLELSRDPDMLSNRVVHVSVQLFSNEGLAMRMTEQLNLLHVMVVSLRYMMGKILIQNTLHDISILDSTKNFHFVVDCGQSVMKDHCYWPLVSDLNNVLSHRPVAWKFMQDDALLDMWFSFLGMFQGMNVNQRELTQHIEFEPNTYYAAFSAELEASAYPMWALVSHLVDHNTAYLTRRVLAACLNALRDWIDAIHSIQSTLDDGYQVSFHLPLHRYYSVFVCQAVGRQGIPLGEILPNTDMLNLLMIHPLRVQVAFYEIINGLWVRNGLQIKGQAMTYIQCNFCNSMVDADLYLLQICCTRIPAENFMNMLLDAFHMRDWLSLDNLPNPDRCEFPMDEQETPMVESLLTFMATLISVRTNLGLSETALNRLEMITLLCMGDKTHSQLMELMPERCGTSQSRDFEALLSEVADYRAPALEATGNMQQGMYVPKAHVWQQQYDPIQVLLRAVHRRDFQTSLDRYAEFGRLSNTLTQGTSPWPPFRMPTMCNSAYFDPREILRSRLFHSLAFLILYKATENHVNENGMALVVFLLEQTLEINAIDIAAGVVSTRTGSPCIARHAHDADLTTWYYNNDFFKNLRTVIPKVYFKEQILDYFAIAYNSDEEDDEDDEENSDDEAAEEDADEDVDRSSPMSEVLMLEDSDWDDECANDTTSRQNPTKTLFVDVERSEAAEKLLFASDEKQEAGEKRAALPSTSQLPPFSPPTRVLPVASSSTSDSETNVAKLSLPSQTTSEASTSEQEMQSTSLVRYQSTQFGKRKGRVRIGSPANGRTLKLNESIISLLLKLHSQLAGEPDSYNPDDAASRRDPNGIGDGTFYIGRLLDKIGDMDMGCKQYIADTRNWLWPKKQDGAEEQKRKEQVDRESRRQRAKERQQKLMQEFANKQKQFMESTTECQSEGESMDWSSEAPSEPRKQEYDCVICNQSSPSTGDKPMGLVVLVQATSILAYRRRNRGVERSVLPTSDDDSDTLANDDTLLLEFDRRCEELNQYFDLNSWLLSLNIGWEGGVHVQTCGHHLHLECLKSYLSSLRSQQRQQSLAHDKGEYYCPLCRQLANSVLPLSPLFGNCMQIVRARPVSMRDVIKELHDLFHRTKKSSTKANLSEAIRQAMTDMTNSTQLKPMFKAKPDKSSTQPSFLFVTSIARTNLEVELVQRGDTLVTTIDEAVNPLLPKRDCIVPLLYVLAKHARAMANWSNWLTFQQLCGEPISSSTTSNVCKEVPLLLHDPIALLIRFVLLLPMHRDQIYFTTIVKVVYNLLYYQIVSQIAFGMTTVERMQVIKNAAGFQIDSLPAALKLINKSLFPTETCMEEDCSQDGSTSVNIVALEQQLQELCLPFLRIAALLRHHTYSQPLPNIRATDSEFVGLVYYLELVTETTDWRWFNAAMALNWIADPNMQTHCTAPRGWCEQMACFVDKFPITAHGFIVEQHMSWQPPRLLQLPHEYEKIFTYYHERPCGQCHSTPTEASICLLCGTIVCLKQNCCKQQNVCEAVAHSLECGAGTGVFLVVTSTYIIVIRGRRACLWGSLYLDDFEEEDRDLKRGKPLYLSKDRYQLLEQQWLAHRFDHTKKTWVWHRDAL